MAKTYPFNMRKNHHNLMLAYNNARLNDDYETCQQIAEINSYLPNKKGIVWLPYKLLERANHFVDFAIIFRVARNEMTLAEINANK